MTDHAVVIFLAVVHAEDGVLFAAAAESRGDLVRRVAEYARRRAAHVLHPDHARYLRTLLARGEVEAAVEVYFGFVGERWDKEWLVTAAVATDDPRSLGVVVGAITPGAMLPVAAASSGTAAAKAAARDGVAAGAAGETYTASRVCRDTAVGALRERK